ncbi:metal ABC transporter permease [Thermonema rossianum]|uniref:metal ABC transporter permease n=1 Tax=Thermonema rossianum TaxID=55505 RepID=UPI000A02AED7|nr:metal ABC transporter permease [Thermonema rossianum]
MISDWWIIVNSALTAACCGILGSFIILRRMSMLVDAISHAVLPGIVIAYLFTESLQSIWLLIGAGLSGFATVWLIESIAKRYNLHEDASIGSIYTSMFALGIILISSLAFRVDLDQECVLYGEVSHTLFDVLVINGKVAGPKAFYLLLGIFIINLAFVLLNYKQLKVMSFDGVFASTIGISTSILHYTLMGLVSFTTVASFEMVGSILVIAYFTALPAIAYLFSYSLSAMLRLCILTGILCAVSGYFIALWWGVSVSGATVLSMGICLLVAIFVSPKKGLLKPWLYAKSK